MDKILQYLSDKSINPFSTIQQYHSESQALVTLPSTAGNQDVTQRPTPTNYLQETPADNLLNDTAQTLSTSQPTAAQNYLINSEPTMPLFFPSAPQKNQEPIVNIESSAAKQSFSQRSTTPSNHYESETTIQRSIPTGKERVPEPTVSRVPRTANSSMNEVHLSEFEPVSKRSKQESSSTYKPGRNEYPSSSVIVINEYKLH